MVRAGAERRRNDTLRAEQQHASWAHRRRNNRAPQTKRHRKEPEPPTDTAGARNDKTPQRTRPTPCTAGARETKRNTAAAGKDRQRHEPGKTRTDATTRQRRSLIFYPVFRLPVPQFRLAPDLRRSRAVPRRAGAVVVGGAPTDRVGGHAGDDGDLNETVSGSPWVTRARPDT